MPWKLVGGTSQTGKGHGQLRWYLTEQQAKVLIEAYRIPSTHSHGSRTCYDTDRIHLVHDAQWNEWVVCVALGDKLGRAQVEWAVQEK